MRKTALLLAIGCVELACSWLAISNGLWWISLFMGLFTTAFIRETRIALLIVLCVGSLSWGLPLAVLALHTPVGKSAMAVEGVIGLSSTGGMLIIGLTIALGCVLSLLGAWVGSALRQVATLLFSK